MGNDPPITSVERLMFGHPGENNLKRIFRDKMVRGVKFERGHPGNLAVCEGCV